MQKKKSGLLDKIRDEISKLGYSKSTEKIYVYWIKRYILFHNKTHPSELTPDDISFFISSLNSKNKSTFNTQKLALSAIKFMYRNIFNRDFDIDDHVDWARKPDKFSVSKIKSTGKKLKVFLCHASDDKELVRKLYKRLLKESVNPWLDEENILPGQNWELEIEKAVRSSDIVIVCISKKSITKAGYVQKEIKFALDVADEQPEGAIFIIPIKLETCVIPNRLKHFQWLNYKSDSDHLKLIQALNHRANTL